MAGRPSKNKGAVDGQSSNPNGQPHMRRIQAVLNSNYMRENAAVEALDWARQQKDPSTNIPFTDRVILADALIALGEKFINGYAIPASSNDSIAISNKVVEQLAERIGSYIDKMVGIALHNAGQGQYLQTEDWRQHREAVESEIHMEVSKAISTSNLAGESYKYEDEDDE